MDPAEDELDIQLRAPRLIGERILVLAVVCRRGFLEGSPGEVAGDEEVGDELEDVETERFDLAAWLREEGIDGAATATERSLLHTRVGSLTPDAVSQATWGAEGLVALAWSVNFVADAPTFDAPTDPGPLLTRLPSPWDSVRTFLSGLGIRPESAIIDERERAELWHWRVGVEAVYRQAAEDERRELRRVILEVARDAENGGILPNLADNDFPVRGRPIARISAPQLDDLTAIAAERLRALNWVCGFGSSWDNVPSEL